MIFSYDKSGVLTAGAVAAEIALVMDGGRQYRLAATTAAGFWFKVVKAGGTGAAVATADSHYVPAGGAVYVAAIGDRNRVSVIRESATDGVAILSSINHVV